MATVYHRKCKVDMELKDPKSGNTFTLEKGRIYSTTRSYQGNVRVLSVFWFWVPREWFGRPKRLTNKIWGKRGLV